jgi:hypothetical protein
MGCSILLTWTRSNFSLFFFLPSSSHLCCDKVLSGDEEHVSGWDLVYDNGFIEIDPELCGYTTFLGAAVPEVDSGGNYETIEGGG